ncbi:hypothetical protein [Pseudomonas sp. TUM22785]|uniref:hypothetical protein n=1 Tax=Pseudomonas sp. TUM22785 TaxID=3019098 RepID=UPI0023059AF8|nr:hypothetical protein [Pseudomonas sp. TUM22785]WCD77870.1 hypothetical protein PI990_17820 [Pseudomonas sp. TUM22785]
MQQHPESSVSSSHSLSHRASHRLKIPVAALLLINTLPALHAAESSFTGSWYLDLRTPEQIQAKAECGGAGFELVQQGNTVTGTHYFATVNCGRINEGGEVKGTVTGSEAVLYVTSGRNGAVVRGRATLQGEQLRWQTLEEIKEGVPEGDSGLVLGDGVLERVAGSALK